MDLSSLLGTSPNPSDSSSQPDSTTGSGNDLASYINDAGNLAKLGSTIYTQVNGGPPTSATVNSPKTTAPASSASKYLPYAIGGAALLVLLLVLKK